MVGVGSTRVGLPGMASLSISIVPMIETIPRIRRDADVGKLPLLPFSSMAMAGMVWASYGLLSNVSGIWCPNLANTALGLCYCWTYCHYCPPGADWLPFTVRFHLGCLAATALTCACVATMLPSRIGKGFMGLAGNFGNVVLFSGPLAAIRTVMKEKSTQSLPLGFTCAVTANCVLWSYYGYVMLRDPQIYVSNMIGLVVAAFQLSLFAAFGVPR